MKIRDQKDLSLSLFLSLSLSLSLSLPLPEIHFAGRTNVIDSVLLPWGNKPGMVIDDSSLALRQKARPLFFVRSGSTQYNKIKLLPVCWFRLVGTGTEVDGWFRSVLRVGTVVGETVMADKHPAMDEEKKDESRRIFLEEHWTFTKTFPDNMLIIVTKRTKFTACRFWYKISLKRTDGIRPRTLPSMVSPFPSDPVPPILKLTLTNLLPKGS